MNEVVGNSMIIAYFVYSWLDLHSYSPRLNSSFLTWCFFRIFIAVSNFFAAEAAICKFCQITFGFLDLKSIYSVPGFSSILIFFYSHFELDRHCWVFWGMSKSNHWSKLFACFFVSYSFKVKSVNSSSILSAKI